MEASGDDSIERCFANWRLQSSFLEFLTMTHGDETMRMKLLAATVIAALAGMNGALAQTDDQTPPPNRDTEKLQTVTVTGSLIPQAQIETASPVITISASQIEKQGFATIYEALRASPLATGAVPTTRIPAASRRALETISLLGLDPIVHAPRSSTAIRWPIIRCCTTA